MDISNTWRLRFLLIEIIGVFKEDRKHYYNLYLNSDEWKEFSQRIKNDRGNKCQLCSSKKLLNVHHNTYERIGKELDSDVVVLCQSCHSKFHGKL